VNPAASTGLRVLEARISSEQDVFALRRQARLVAQALGLEGQDQVRMATALSELGRDLLRCAGARAEFTLVAGPPTALTVTLRWQQGPAPSSEALDSASRLLPRVGYDADDPSRGITVTQALSARPDQLPQLAARVAEVLSAYAETSREDDLRAQTRDLIESLAQTRAQRDELHRLNEELEQTNAGVVALYTELSRELEQTNSGVVALLGELEDKSRQLREASEAKTRFWANVSHELRTPVNSVIGLARLLLSEPPEALTDEQRQQAGLIASSGNTLLALVDELLDVAKAESGQLVPQPAPVDLRTLLVQLYGMMRATASQTGTALVIPQQEPFPARIVTDEVMLTRVLRNLLSNSLKFTEGGEVRLEVRAQPGQGSEQLPQWLEFEVGDTGVGIPQDEQDRIFEEFYQVRGPHQRGRTGTGLGLPYARRLTELLGGTLAISSAPGQGTTVTVRLPTGEPARTEPAVATAFPRLATLVSVDDDPEFSVLVRPLLERLAERVVQIGLFEPQIDGADPVLEAVRRERPDAILVDLRMPSVDGYELVGLLGADAELHGIPVIVVTSAPSRFVDRSRLAHARAVVDKGNLTQAVLAAALAAPRGDGSGSALS
jgi:signal transduction histidine kinase/CheY-like chemotaxis protein